jgi:hypothetical protein
MKCFLTILVFIEVKLTPEYMRSGYRLEVGKVGQL